MKSNLNGLDVLMAVLLGCVIAAAILLFSNNSNSAFMNAIDGCEEGNTAKLTVVSGRWGDSVTFSCEWVVPGGIVVKHE